jgi:hypothetical protein
VGYILVYSGDFVSPGATVSPPATMLP